MTEFRTRIDQIDEQILRLLCERGMLIREEGKDVASILEKQVMERIMELNTGPFAEEDLQLIFNAIVQASKNLLSPKKNLLVSREMHPHDTRIVIRGYEVGGTLPTVIAGPCAVESADQIQQIAKSLSANGANILRGGAFKPRTSPYTFRGLGEPGLCLLQKAGQDHGLLTISEVMDTRDVAMVSQYVDILQVGSRNMSNFPLLREVGKGKKPVLLKRGMASTIEEFLFAAEYILAEGNQNVILCERGIRTFETMTRFTLDINAIILLKQKTHLPVVADVSHASGIRDLVTPLARACLAAGANGIMLEVHDDPDHALSDPEQQIDLSQFRALLQSISIFKDHPNKSGIISEDMEAK
jgi:3-deoxy-7-phosphoheptulonate synthase / chorismate mutase